jgi:hypothetical protein
MSAPTCTGCGKSLGSKSASRCGACSKSATQAARAATHVYQRVHVHVWLNGARTIESGLVCACEEADSEGAA